jgi:hypothetical protein
VQQILKVQRKSPLIETANGRSGTFFRPLGKLKRQKGIYAETDTTSEERGGRGSKPDHDPIGGTALLTYDIF